MVVEDLDLVDLMDHLVHHLIVHPVDRLEEAASVEAAVEVVSDAC